MIQITQKNSPELDKLVEIGSYACDMSDTQQDLKYRCSWKDPRSKTTLKQRRINFDIMPWSHIDSIRCFLCHVPGRIVLSLSVPLFRLCPL